MTYSVLTSHPTADYSLDYRVPRGAKNDDTRCSEFLDRCELLCLGQKIRYLDIGCAGGGLVRSFRERGHSAFGIDGCDLPGQDGRWDQAPGCFDSCDATFPLLIENGGGGLAQFDIISAWEVLEHLRTAGVPTFFDNVHRHLAPRGIFIASVSDTHDYDQSGEDYHVSVMPAVWWEFRAAEAGLVTISPILSGHQHPRGPESVKQDPGFYLTLARG